jgi:hypothetical protein
VILMQPKQFCWQVFDSKLLHLLPTYWSPSGSYWLEEKRVRGVNMVRRHQRQSAHLLHAIQQNV